ncbi:MAG TPA: hypothetical protein ENI12_04040 [Nitrospirae bacterium]|nr:hypothetical protein [Nitrospirota bacterium]
MKRTLIYIVIASALVAGFAGVSAAAGIKSHMDIVINPDECMSCHAGRGISGTALLRHSREGLCFNCHGDNIRSRRKNIAKTNIKAVMEKMSASTRPSVYEHWSWHAMQRRLTLPVTRNL